MNKKDIVDIINDNSLEYSAYVIKHRALPDLRDGMKPVYRRILYTMHKMKATSLTKSQNVEGQVMKFHPHAGSYGTMVGMVQKDNNILPFIEGKGNFGQHTSRDMQEGAPRYTEVKLSQISKEIFSNLNSESVNWISNYDGTAIMPEVLPVKFPTILTQAQEGIAYGMASKIPSFNIAEVCDSIILYIEEEKETVLMPDFATGGSIVEDYATFEKINFTGLGSFKIRARARIEKNSIIIDQIPYTTSREVIIEGIIKAVAKKQIAEIKDVVDLTGLNKMEIEIECKKGSDMELVLQKLYKHTKLEDSYSCNMNMLHNGLPSVYGVWDIVDHWLDWRFKCIIKEYEGRIEALNKELQEINALKIIRENTEEVVNAIINIDPKKMIAFLKSKYEMTEEQAEYISNLSIKKFNKIYIEKKIREEYDLIDKIEEYNFIIESDDLKNKIIINDLKDISFKYGKERKTKIVKLEKDVVEKINKVNEVKDYDVDIIVTKDGFIYKTTKDEEVKMKNDDIVTHRFKTRNSGELVLFVGKDAYKIRNSSLQDYKSGSFGEYLSNITEINIGEVLGITMIDDNNKFILISYDNGKVAKVDLTSFKTKTNTKKLKNSLYNDAEVLEVLTFSGDEEFVVINKKGLEVVKNTKEMITKSSRNTQGVVVVKNMVQIKHSEQMQVYLDI